jgi:hypothetical protein
VHWHDRYQAWLQRQVSGDTAPDGLLLAAVLIHSIQPAYYADELQFLTDLTRKIEAQTPKELLHATLIVSNVTSYYAATSKPTTPPFADFTAIRDSLFFSKPDWIDSKIPLHRWLTLVRENFLGLTYHKLSLHPDAPSGNQYLEAASEAFNNAQSALLMFSESEHDTYWNLWRGYVLRNIGRVQWRLNKVGDAKASSKEACQLRGTVIGYFRNLLPEATWAELRLESTLISLDLAQQTPSPENHCYLAEASTVLRETNVSRRAAIWRRAQFQLIEIAKNSGYALSPELA